MRNRIISGLAGWVVCMVSAHADTGALIERLYRLDTLPVLQPEVRCRMFSSFDRLGGNNDGFSGMYSRLRLEDGDSVIAEMKGPGAIARIWFTHSEHYDDGLLQRKGEHIRIYLDGNPEPAVDIPLEALFSGELEAFPAPLAGSGLGGFYCYVPIPYRDGCKVVIEGDFVRFYHLQYLEFPDDEGVVSFSMNMEPETKRRLDRAVDAWSNPGNLDALRVGHLDTHEFAIDLAGEDAAYHDLPSGPTMVRAVRWKGDDLRDLTHARIHFHWDGAETPSLSVPLSFLFAAHQAPLPFKSLLAGWDGDAYYCYIPMPYRHRATVAITAAEPIAGRLIVETHKYAGDPAAVGYLHGVYREALPVKEEDPRWLWAERWSRGHFAGVFMSTDGAMELPYWLEGDEVFTVDGKIDIHGTGSEDYFNCGWYAVDNRLNQPGALPLHGFPQYKETGGYSYAAAFRWHLVDVVPYGSHLHAAMEHGGDNDVSANYRSAAYFYDERP